jgi:hypothetical protein
MCCMCIAKVTSDTFCFSDAFDSDIKRRADDDDNFTSRSVEESVYLDSSSCLCQSQA